MTRKEAWEEFKTAHMEEQNRLKQEFWENLNERLGELMSCIYAAFEEAARQIELQEKENCMYFLFALQRCDLCQGKALVRLDVLDMEWYLDEAPVTVCFDITFLFREYMEWREKLLTDIREYMGKINRYDIDNLIQDEIMVCNQLITHILRFAFRNLEQQQDFAGIPKLPLWIIRWGEYRDYSEIVMQVNRSIRDQEAWEDRIRHYEVNSGAFMAEYWYRGNLTSGDCSRKKMCFMVFEECSLSNIDFQRADLSGARFIRCRIENCDFSRATLHQADFEDCDLLENNFEGAHMSQATFSREGFRPELFGEEQLNELYVVSEMTDEEMPVEETV